MPHQPSVVAHYTDDRFNQVINLICEITGFSPCDIRETIIAPGKLSVHHYLRDSAGEKFCWCDPDGKRYSIVATDVTTFEMEQE